jgi:tRNA modification GTPase
MLERSTIVGVATGTADGGVAIVRVSGPSAMDVALRLGAPPSGPRRLVRRALAVRGGLEDALVVSMPGPGSYTGEDIVEFHVHAGARNVEAVLGACVAAGCRPAQAGEFTRRAFEHGRLSLEQAEGIAALIGAQTQAGLDQARRLVAGELGRDVDVLLERLLDLRAELEARLDFPDDVDGMDVARWRGSIDGVVATLRAWLSRYDAGARARLRPRVVLAGPPNAGKSSLFNTLLGYSRAIVTPSPGTTRDYVEAELDLGATSCILVDTAGLREVEDAIERAGVERSHGQIEGADLVLWIEAADAADAAPGVPSLPTVAIERLETKRDLGVRRPAWRGVSTTDAESVEALRAWLREDRLRDAASGWIGLARHRESCEHACAELGAAAQKLGSLELAAFHLELARLRLGEIRGRTALGAVGEDVMRRVFERFCIGK